MVVSERGLGLTMLGTAVAGGHKAQWGQAMLRNASVLSDDEEEEPAAAFVPSEQPLTGEDVVWILVLGLAALVGGYYMFRIKRHYAMKHAMNRDARDIGDGREFTRTRDV